MCIWIAAFTQQHSRHSTYLVFTLPHLCCYIAACLTLPHLCHIYAATLLPVSHCHICAIALMLLLSCSSICATALTPQHWCSNTHTASSMAPHSRCHIHASAFTQHLCSSICTAVLLLHSSDCSIFWQLSRSSIGAAAFTLQHLCSSSSTSHSAAFFGCSLHAATLMQPRFSSSIFAAASTQQHLHARAVVYCRLRTALSLISYAEHDAGWREQGLAGEQAGGGQLFWGGGGV